MDVGCSGSGAGSGVGSDVSCSGGVASGLLTTLSNHSAFVSFLPISSPISGSGAGCSGSGAGCSVSGLGCSVSALGCSLISLFGSVIFFSFSTWSSNFLNFLPVLLLYPLVVLLVVVLPFSV